MFLALGMICVYRKSHKCDSVFVDRNNAVICEINKLQSKKGKAV